MNNFCNKYFAEMLNIIDQIEILLLFDIFRNYNNLAVRVKLIEYFTI